MLILKNSQFTFLVLIFIAITAMGQVAELAPMTEEPAEAVEVPSAVDVASPDSTADTLVPRVRPEEPMELLGLELGKAGEYIAVEGDYIDMQDKKIVYLLDPEEPQDAATKSYVDDKVQIDGQPKATSTNRKLFRNY